MYLPISTMAYKWLSPSGVHLGILDSKFSSVTISAAGAIVKDGALKL